MALASGNFMTGSGGYGTTLATKLDKLDCSQVLAAVLLADKQLLGHIRMGAAGTTIEHNWLEDELSPAYVLAQTAASTTCTIVGGVPGTSTSLRRIVRDNAILQPAGSQWLFQVATNNATVLTGATYGNTTAAYAASDTTTKMYIIANPYTDVSDASDDISQARTKKKNFMQIFERAVAISQTRKNMDMEAVLDELQLQIKYRTMEIKRELDMSVIRGYARGLTPSGSYEMRTMAGLIQLIRDPDLDGGTMEDTTVINAGSTALTIAGLNSLCYKVFDGGGLDETSDPILVVGPKQQRIIAAFEKELRRVEQGERITGYYRDIFLSDMGVEFPIVLDRWFPGDMVMLLDRSRVALVPLQGDAWHIEKMAKTGRSEKWQISGQYTLELRNADKCHGLIYGLS
jgi:hypothetical protein